MIIYILYKHNNNNKNVLKMSHIANFGPDPVIRSDPVNTRTAECPPRCKDNIFGRFLILNSVAHFAHTILIM